jgi:hypothetical protein
METVHAGLVEHPLYRDRKLDCLGQWFVAASGGEQTFGRPNGGKQSATKRNCPSEPATTDRRDWGNGRSG